MRKLKVSETVEKSREISNSVMAYYLSVGLFVLLALSGAISTILEPDIISIFMAVLSVLLLYQSVIGLKEAKAVQIAFEVNPEAQKNTPVPKPMLYRAIFWYMPR